MAECWTGTATIFDNKYLTKKVRDGYIQKFKGTVDEQARLYGKAVRRSGLLYPTFDRETLVVPYNDTFIKEKFPVIRAIDPHPQIPIHVLWLALDPAGFAYIVNELVCPENAKISACARLIKAKEANMNIIYGVIDTLGSTPQLDSGMSITQLFAAEEVYSRNAHKDFPSGHALVEKALQGVDIIDRETKDVKTLHKFFIFENCIETIYEFQHCTWDEPSSTVKEKDPSEKQKKFRNHMLDLVRYLLKEFPHFENIDVTTPKSFFGGRTGTRW